jgi:hypothetical protein
MARRESRVNEEKMLNDMFIALEYSDSFKEFIESVSDDVVDNLHKVIHDRIGLDPTSATGKSKR